MTRSRFRNFICLLSFSLLGIGSFGCAERPSSIADSLGSDTPARESRAPRTSRNNRGSYPREEGTPPPVASDNYDDSYTDSSRPEAGSRELIMDNGDRIDRYPLKSGKTYYVTPPSDESRATVRTAGNGNDILIENPAPRRISLSRSRPTEATYSNETQRLRRELSDEKEAHRRLESQLNGEISTRQQYQKELSGERTTSSSDIQTIYRE